MLNYWCWKLCGVVTVDTSAERGMITFCLFRSKGVFECMHHSCVSLRRFYLSLGDGGGFAPTIAGHWVILTFGLSPFTFLRSSSVPIK